MELSGLKATFNMGRPMWYHFHGVFFTEFSLHLVKITGTKYLIFSLVGNHCRIVLSKLKQIN